MWVDKLKKKSFCSINTLGVNKDRTTCQSLLLPSTTQI